MEPHIIHLKTSAGKGGELSVIDEGQLPFQVKRSYWIYNLKEDAQRGGHVHLNSDRILVCLQGEAQVKLRNRQGEEWNFTLNDPGKVLYFPQQFWIDMTCMQGSIMMALTSCSYAEDKLETDWDKFCSL
ncbi:sugar 3,4-ketoisomerase [Fulvivirga sediminis]|uniref:FdtA/QdtA family cupin domain-containing protein n=1 Tax=Fulvivirga sediminis TaxID=2803949 RepID=A0A937F912_9BACT|nr:FdtA/QdtA family cupin domain-containing protein [Fulvivirga sediminis]MBL3656490.1 FdtA/QdtA family cupin domain-containing protein [Fulvivirga sediminis]